MGNKKRKNTTRRNFKKLARLMTEAKRKKNTQKTEVEIQEPTTSLGRSTPTSRSQTFESNPSTSKMNPTETLLSKEPDEEVQIIDDALDKNLPLVQIGNSVTGRRIVDINHFFNEIITFKHNNLFNCNSTNIHIINEARKGFISLFTVKCKLCLEQKVVSTDSNKDTVDINTAIVMGSTCTGGGYAQTQEMFGNCNIPVISSYLYTKVQNSLADVIHDVAWETIAAAGREEKSIALQKGNVHSDGIPYITVIADGAWSKRSYKVNYDALSGVAVIIGRETGKVLFLGVRNKYCCVCSRATSKKIEIPIHKCYKNWEKSSTAMESDILLEGFLKSVEMHGLKYQYLVGDGDSSITKKLVIAKPYEHEVQKIECRNHLLRNFCSKLRDLTKKRLSSKQCVVDVILRNNLDKRIKRLRYGVIAAINHAKDDLRELSHFDQIRILKKDLHNAPLHVFGDHSQCESYFCKGPKFENEKNWIPSMRECGLLQDIFSVMERLVRNAESLLINMDNNAAETFNSIIAKYIGGKRINFSSKRSYLTRCEAAAISYNVPTSELSRTIHKKITGHSPGKYTKKIICARSKQMLSKNVKRKLLPSKKKINIAPADEDYGLPSLDMDEEEYEREKKAFVDHLRKSAEEILDLQGKTINTVLWIEERRKRVTASLFGNICKMRKTTHCASLVQSILYSSFTGSIATQWGQDHEKQAIHDFSVAHNVNVAECGLFVDLFDPYLGATPDGLIEDDGIVEVKCPFKVRNMTAIDALQHKKITFAILENGEMKLKENHNYYYQVQGQLHVTRRKYCIFIFWTPLSFLYQKIYRDDDFWNRRMDKPLHVFFFKCLLPEIINPQKPRGRKIKDLRQS